MALSRSMDGYEAKTTENTGMQKMERHKAMCGHERCPTRRLGFSVLSVANF